MRFQLRKISYNWNTLCVVLSPCKLCLSPWTQTVKPHCDLRPNGQKGMQTKKGDYGRGQENKKLKKEKKQINNQTNTCSPTHMAVKKATNTKSVCQLSTINQLLLLSARLCGWFFIANAFPHHKLENVRKKAAMGEFLTWIHGIEIVTLRSKQTHLSK